MINLTLRTALQAACAEFDFQQTKKLDHQVKGSLNEYLAAIDEIDELIDCGETIDEAFNATFESNKQLYKFLSPIYNKYKNA